MSDVPQNPAKNPPKNAEFFFVSIDDLKSGVPLPLTVYLYFKRNDHMLAWIKTGDLPPDERIARYRSRGLTAIWIRNSDQERWDNYRKEQQIAQAPTHLAPAVDQSATPEMEAAQATSAAAAPKLAEAAPDQTPTPEMAATAVASEGTPQLAPLTEKAEKIIAQLETPNDDPKLKAALVAREARKSLSETLNNSDRAVQDALNKEARTVAAEVLSSMGQEIAAMVEEIWKLADLDTGLTHSVNVASYSVLFALAFGKIEPALLIDLARAGLFHDFGVSQIPSHIAQKSWMDQSENEKLIYRTHVAKSVELARRFDPTLTERSLMMIGQTHEKFNGTGYPVGLEGFKLDPSAQVVAIAEMLDSIASGAYDGDHRTYQEALVMLAKIEQNTNFPENFNPDIFRTVLKWVKRTDQVSATKEALALVQSETQAIVAEKVKSAA